MIVTSVLHIVSERTLLPKEIRANNGVLTCFEISKCLRLVDKEESHF